MGDSATIEFERLLNDPVTTWKTLEQRQSPAPFRIDLCTDPIKMSESCQLAVKSTCELPASAATCFDLLTRLDTRRLWDSMMDKAELIQYINPTLVVQYHR